MGVVRVLFTIISFGTLYVFRTGERIGVNPAGDTGDVSPPKIGLRGTVMHYVPPNLASSLVL